MTKKPWKLHCFHFFIKL